MDQRYVLAFDQGTTSSRSLLFTRDGAIAAIAQREFEQIYPKPGWVEHDASAIWETQLDTAREAMAKAGASPGDIAAIGITNQRETTVVWDRTTGKPIHNAIVWQCRRTTEICEQLKAAGLEDDIRRRTGLVVDAYFSGTKVKWLLDNVPGARMRAEHGELCFGTIDSWLLFNLTGRHITDYSNASRTMLYNIVERRWDPVLLDALGIPEIMLPEVVPTSEVYAETTLLGGSIPVASMVGDQQAALFGQAAFNVKDSKNTYGTGCFMLVNTGGTPVPSENGLLTTIAWGIGGEVEYAMEGSVFIAGAVIQWLRDELKLISSAAESEAVAAEVPDSNGVYLVPAFTGLGAPWWDMRARGVISGLTRGAGRAHIVRAALESISFQVADVVRTIKKDSGEGIAELRVDGGACANNLLMQHQADVLGVPVVRGKTLETTALGAAYLAGLAVGFWSGKEEIRKVWQEDKRFLPKWSEDQRQQELAGWDDAVRRTRSDLQ
jgi:glycerol kinase